MAHMLRRNRDPAETAVNKLTMRVFRIRTASIPHANCMSCEHLGAYSERVCGRKTDHNTHGTGLLLVVRRSLLAFTPALAAVLLQAAKPTLSFLDGVCNSGIHSTSGTRRRRRVGDGFSALAA